MDAFDLIAAGKIKRYFRATKKLNTPGIISHITQRAAGKEPLFLEDGDYLFMLKLLKEISKNYLIELYAFCLMTNHVHLLLSPIEENLYDAMRDLFSRYAMYFNRKYERKGHLFGGPYRQAICYDERYLMAVSLYIHLNPVVASIVENPADYRWSSIRLYHSDDAPESFVKPDHVLNLLSNDRSESRTRYRQLLRKGTAVKTGYVMERENAIERFESKMAVLFPTLFKRIEKSGSASKSFGTDLMSLAALEEKIAEVNSCPAFPEKRNAQKYLIEQLLSRGYTRREIAAKLGISRKTIYNILQKN